MSRRKMIEYKTYQRLIVCLLPVIFICMGCDDKKITSPNELQKAKKAPTFQTVLKETNIDIPRFEIDHDEDQDGIKDLEDILIGAREDVKNKPTYRSAYYSGGYPPTHEGVCTDVIWRAFKEAGYNLKEMLDKDIAENKNMYPRVNGKPDPNIDFRRVQNLVVFFKRYAQVLTTDVIPKDAQNLQEWQGGDIVVFDTPVEHIAIVSDVRNEEGIPYMIHNSGPYTKEEDALLYWDENISPIIYHFRFPIDRP